MGNGPEMVCSPCFLVAATDLSLHVVVLIDEFASLIASGSKPDIETLSEKSFDPRNQYSSVIKAVRAAVAASDSKVSESDVEVKVYRVEVGHSRVEYWVIALDGAEGKIVGLRAKAIES